MRAPFAIAVVLAAACSAPSGAAAAEGAAEGVAVTVYSGGFSVVKERRKVALQEGRNALRFDGVAAQIDGSTVTFRSLTDPGGTSVLEQSFEYDLASANRVLERCVGGPITIQPKDGVPIEGTLLSFDGGQIVVRDSRIRILRRDENLKEISFPDLPGGLVTKPTLMWLVSAGKGGEHLVENAYETKGMGWNADYAAVFSADEKKADLSAWVTLRNQSGATYADAVLKLVAGDVNRAEGDRGPPRAAAAKARGAMESEGFAEKTFFEYHMYTLGRPTTLPDRSLKQIELFHPVSGVPCRKVYLYDGLRGLSPWYGDGVNMDQGFGATGNRKVGVFLEIENRKENGLGMALPAGRVRVHKRDDADGFPELVGEDRIDHTAKDETLRLKMGDAFDVVGERKQTDFRVDRGGHWAREAFEIRVRNHREEEVEVLVAERLYRGVNWTIEARSHDYVKKDSRLVQFPLRVPKDGEAVLTYTVLYTW
jgi:hypothetical protein